MARKHVGSSFDEFLQEEGLLAEVTAAALKKVVAWQLEQKRRQSAMSKSSLARKMNTSRAQVNRLLDQQNPAMTLESLTGAARALGQQVKIELVPVSSDSSVKHARRERTVA
jgi:antitoxin HicB